MPWKTDNNEGLVVLHFYLEFITSMPFLSGIHYALPLVSEFVYDLKPCLTKYCYKHSKKVHAPNYAIFQRY